MRKRRRVFSVQIRGWGAIRFKLLYTRGGHSPVPGMRRPGVSVQAGLTPDRLGSRPSCGAEGRDRPALPANARHQNQNARERLTAPTRLTLTKPSEVGADTSPNRCFTQVPANLSYCTRVLHKPSVSLISREWKETSPKAAPRGDVSISIGLSITVFLKSPGESVPLSHSISSNFDLAGCMWRSRADPDQMRLMGKLDFSHDPRGREP